MIDDAFAAMLLRFVVHSGMRISAQKTNNKINKTWQRDVFGRGSFQQGLRPPLQRHEINITSLGRSMFASAIRPKQPSCNKLANIRQATARSTSNRTFDMV